MVPNSNLEALKLWAIAKLEYRAARLLDRRFVLFPILRARILLGRAAAIKKLSV